MVWLIRTSLKEVSMKKQLITSALVLGLAITGLVTNASARPPYAIDIQCLDETEGKAVITLTFVQAVMVPQPDGTQLLTDEQRIVRKCMGVGDTDTSALDVIEDYRGNVKETHVRIHAWKGLTRSNNQNVCGATSH